MFQAKKPLELVHADLCGLITPTTVGRSKYFLLLIDDFSRWSWVYMLTGKYQAFDAFKRYKKMVEENSGYKVKTLRGDREGEFTSMEFTNFCKENGITRHLTAPYSPQQNGVMERRNRTVMEMARSLLKGRNVPGEFWGEAVRHAVYLLNCLPSKSFPNITPYEAWYGKKPNLKHLKTFSCIVFDKYTGGHLKKLDDRGKKMVYLGVKDGTKGNRLYDPQERKLRVNRDVLFDEKESRDWCKSMEEDRPVTNTFTIIKPPYEIPSETPQNSPKTTHNQREDSEFETVVSGQPYPEDVQADLDPNNAALDPFSSPSIDSSYSSNAIGPRGFRSLDDIYARTHEVTLQSEELMMVETDQPSTFEEAVNFKAWREAMQAELDAIEKNKTQKVFKLFKALYGLRKAPRAWNVRLDKSMKGLGYLKSSQDPAIYTRNLKGKPLIVGVYVDDLIITRSHTHDIVEFKEQMKNEFEMSDLGLLAYYLGIEVSQKI
nr:hypothetical protein [Tanacetum cinerariifolium]